MKKGRQKLVWYRADIDDVAKALTTDVSEGLSGAEAQKRLQRVGKNKFEAGRRETLLGKITAQLKSPLVFILMIAGFATVVLKEYTDAIVIFTAVLINIIIGVIQEKRADKAFEKLAASQEKLATVVRDGEKMVISAEEVVPGDVIIVDAGMFVPADARIISSTNCTVNESVLTGEWVDVAKEDVSLAKEARITEQTNMLWMGTLVTSGSARAVVVATGNDTQIGKIAYRLSYTEEQQTPMQKSIKNLAAFLAKATLLAISIIFIIGIARGETLSEMLLIGIALAVAVMPEGLPAAVTVVLALGMEAILKKGGLVRNLLAAETLGGTTVILTDKTGTLTMAEMRVASITTLHSEEVKKEKGKVFGSPDERDVLGMAILTSDAFVEKKGDALSKWVVRGRPVERAIVLAGLDSGIHQETLLKAQPRLDFLPFESKRRFVASLHSVAGKKNNRVYFAGAPEVFLEHATHIYEHGKAVRLTKTIREKLQHIQEEKSAEGMRLIAVAYKEAKDEKIPECIVKELGDCKTLVFAGFIALHDPLRDDVPAAIRTAKEAGTRVIMLTGDNPATALKIATEAGIAKDGDRAMTGDDLEKLSDEELAHTLRTTAVFARVLPDQKLRIAKLLKNSGEVVAMTGDGINDAPALKNADIGIALGSGTEVAKEASDMVLINNSFSVIVSAIEEGRRILDNLKKIVVYLLSTGFTEIFIVGAALVAGTPLPILPTQILWVNILQEGFMNFAFAFEPKEDGVMKRNPSLVAMRTILTPKLKKLITLIAIVTGLSLVALYFFLLFLNIPIEEVRTVIFIGLSASSLFYTFSIKNLHAPLWKIRFFSNKYLILSFATSVILLVAALVFTPLQKLLSLAPPTAGEFLLIFAFGVFNLIVIELAKYFIFRPSK